AIEAGQKAIASDALDANSLNNLAWSHFTCGSRFRDLNKARDYAERAVELTQHKNAQFLDTLAEIQHKQGDHDLARTSFLEAIAIASNRQRRTIKAKFIELFPNESQGESKEARK